MGRAAFCLVSGDSGSKDNGKKVLVAMGGCLGDLKNAKNGSEMWESGALTTRSFSSKPD